MITYYALHQHHESFAHTIDTGVKSFHFPAGEVHTEVPDFSAYYQLAYVQYGSDSDIVELAMWADAMKRSNKKTMVVVPYLPGARMDRGVPLGVKVYADMINAMGIDRVVCLDPHSDVAPALYDRLTVVRLAQVMPPVVGFTGVIAPDLGARKRAEEVASLYALPLYQAQKHREFKTGKLSGFECERLAGSINGRYLIVDDICDGGGTFNGLADHLYDTQGIVRSQLGLWVTHGIFSNDAALKLSEFFSYVGTTDSHPGSATTQGSYACTKFDVYPILNKLVQLATK